jgi:DNA invertase Pin-like site-specific DNA recombinase
MGSVQPNHGTPIAVLFLHQRGVDTSTPSGRAMFQMLAVFAEFERAMIRERDWLARARAEGNQLGRRPVVVSRIFRTFDQATASVCMTCGW